MSMGYSLTVTCEGAEQIEINTFAEAKAESINNVTFRKVALDTESSNKRSNAIRYEFEISGTIIAKENGTKESTQKLAQWALDESTSTLYRSIEIVVGEDSENQETEKTLRRYNFSNIYVINYEEVLSTLQSNEYGSFKLHLGQKTEKSQRDINIT